MRGATSTRGGVIRAPVFIAEMTIYGVGKAGVLLHSRF